MMQSKEKNFHIPVDELESVPGVRTLEKAELISERTSETATLRETKVEDEDSSGCELGNVSSCVEEVNVVEGTSSSLEDAKTGSEAVSVLEEE